MHRFYELAARFLNTRRSLPYVKFDKAIKKKINNEICILSYLKSHSGEVHPKDLSEEFIVSTARMAVILNQLEKKGFVVRLADVNDNRQTVVRLEEKGRNFFEAENGKIQGFIARFFKELGEEDANEFVRLYIKLMDYVAKVE